MVEIYREQRVQRKEAPFQNVNRTASTFLKALNHLGSQKRKRPWQALRQFRFFIYKLGPAI